MPDSEPREAAPASPEAPKPESPPVDRGVAAPERRIRGDVPSWLKLLRTLATLEGVPGWAPTVFAILMALSSWKGMYDLFLPSVQTVGGGAVMIFGHLASPGAPLVLAAAGLVYLMYLSQAEEGSARAVWLPIVGWLGMMIFCTTIGSLMFVDFVRSSKIPDAVA